MKLTVDKEGNVFFDGQKLNVDVIRVDLENIHRIDRMEVILHIAVDEADIQHKHW